MFLRGYFGQHPLGPQLERAEPLYPADVRALIDACLRPTWQQVRDAAFLALMNATGLRKTEMRELRWQDIRIHRDHLAVHAFLRKSRAVPVAIDLTVHAHRSADVCPVRWITRLRQLTPLGDRPVFATRGERVATTRLTGYAQQIDQYRSGPQLLGTPTLNTGEMRELISWVTRPLPIGYRDRFAILAGFLGGLTNQEATRITVADIRVSKSGLILHVAGRPWPDVGLPRNEDPRYCPVHAWRDWARILNEARQGEASHPALVGCDRYVPNLSATPLSIDALGRLVTSRTDQAGLVGQFAYSSLRNGFIRTATQAGVPPQEVAAHVGHRTLDGVLKRYRNEVLMDSTVHRRMGM
jgi:integrase